MLDDYLQYSNHHTSSPEVNIIVFILHVLMWTLLFWQLTKYYLFTLLNIFLQLILPKEKKLLSLEHHLLVCLQNGAMFFFPPMPLDFDKTNAKLLQW